MNPLFKPAFEQASFLVNKRVACFFSGGKDAIVTADLYLKFAIEKPLFVFFYFVEGLEINERILRYYEKLWSIKIERRPCHETLSIISRETGGRKYSYADVEQATRREFGIEWTVTGMKRADSLARRGMFKGVGDDWMEHDKTRAYPVLGWTDKQIIAYCKLNKLPLPVTYNHGISRSFWIPNAEYLMWLRPLFPRDYEKIVNFFPQLGDAVYRRELGK